MARPCCQPRPWRPRLPGHRPALLARRRRTTLQLIVTYEGRPGKAAERAVKRLGGTVKQNLKLIDGLAVDLPRGQLKQLKKDPAVKAVEVDGTLTPFDHGPSTGDLEYENAWGVEHIGSREVHLAGNIGQGIKVAIIDTGIDYIHDDPDDQPYVVDPEFLSNYQGGYDFFNNDADPYDDNGHGTHVAGILAAEHNGYLVTGVAPGVDLYALKVLSAAGRRRLQRPHRRARWAVDHDMDVVNMSLGGHEVSTGAPGGHRGGLRRRRHARRRERATSIRAPSTSCCTAARSPIRPRTTRSSPSRSRTPRTS